MMITWQFPAVILGCRLPENRLFLLQNQYGRREETFMELEALKQIDGISVLLECK